MHACMLACSRACVYLWYGMRVCECFRCKIFNERSDFDSIRNIFPKSRERKETKENKGILIGLYSFVYWLQCYSSYFHISTQKFSGEMPMAYVTTAHPLITITNDDNRHRTIQFKHQFEFQTTEKTLPLHTCI